MVLGGAGRPGCGVSQHQAISADRKSLPSLRLVAGELVEAITAAAAAADSTPARELTECLDSLGGGQ